MAMRANYDPAILPGISNVLGGPGNYEDRDVGPACRPLTPPTAPPRPENLEETARSTWTLLCAAHDALNRLGGLPPTQSDGRFPEVEGLAHSLPHIRDSAESLNHRLQALVELVGRV